MIAALCVGLTACSPAAQTENSFEKLKESGTVRAAFITHPPDSFINEATGKLDGAGPAVLSTIMKKLGIEIDPILTDFDAVIPGLKANRWDISAWGFYVTPTRCEQVAFTNPTAQYLEGAMVAKGNPLGISSYKDFANPALRIGLGSGNAEIEWVKAAGAKDSQIKLFQDEPLAFEALRNGQIDVYANARFSIIQGLRNYDPTGLELANPFTGPIVDGKEVVSYGAWALRSDDKELREAFNVELKKLSESGELLKLQEPFGFDALSIPDPTITSASLCPSASWAK